MAAAKAAADARGTPHAGPMLLQCAFMSRRGMCTLLCEDNVASDHHTCNQDHALSAFFFGC